MEISDYQYRNLMNSVRIMRSQLKEAERKYFKTKTKYGTKLHRKLYKNQSELWQSYQDMIMLARDMRKQRHAHKQSVATVWHVYAQSIATKRGLEPLTPPIVYGKVCVP